MQTDSTSTRNHSLSSQIKDNMMVKGGKRKAPDSVKSNNTKIKHKDDNMPSPTKRAKTTPTAKFSGQGKSITVKRDPSEETTPKDEEQDGYDDNTDVKPKTNNSKSKTSPSKSSTSVSSPFTHLDLSALGRLPASMDSSKLDKFAPSPLLRLALLNEALRQVKATSMDWEKVVRDAEELGDVMMEGSAKKVAKVSGLLLIMCTKGSVGCGVVERCALEEDLNPPFGVWFTLTITVLWPDFQETSRCGRGWY